MLPKIFKPIYIDNNDLIRIGSLNDGGYILSKDLTKNLNLLISFGISDNLNETKWFEDLHHLLNKKKAKIIKKDKLFYIKFFIKFFKKFVAEIVFTVFVKIFFESKNKNLTRKKNCFYAVLSNFVVFEDKFIDRQYGLGGLKKT